MAHAQAMSALRGNARSNAMLSVAGIGDAVHQHAAGVGGLHLELQRLPEGYGLMPQFLGELLHQRPFFGGLGLKNGERNVLAILHRGHVLVPDGAARPVMKDSCNLEPSFSVTAMPMLEPSSLREKLAVVGEEVKPLNQQLALMETPVLSSAAMMDKSISSICKSVRRWFSADHRSSSPSTSSSICVAPPSCSEAYMLAGVQHTE